MFRVDIDMILLVTSTLVSDTSHLYSANNVYKLLEFVTYQLSFSIAKH